ncbi:branched-chain amino acid ABC transporter permease [Halomarina halobia]|uniref:Branched-chain amino acid ABC transporter permease n=1 Tax=Halomarina halobia TaxID=3033386 RepID=A0ABD6ACA3_9EURY|nr:branched-chain amino acid ABC transporter permease [Halomarina sp. PSR21]
MTSASVLVGLTLNGIAIGMLLLLVASGLSLIFGLMGVVNFAHGSLYMFGAYFGLVLFDRTGIFVVALLVAPFFVAGIGVLMEYLTLRPLYGRDPLYQILLTFGIALILDEIVILVWGPNALNFAAPSWVTGVFNVAGAALPVYRVFVICLGAVIAVGLYLFLQRTRYGLVVRAGTANRTMVEANGINVKRAFTIMFAVGAGMAAVGGVVAGPMLSVYPAMGLDMVIEAFIVVVIGGLGSFRGSVVGALLAGLAQAYGSFYVPTLSSIIIFTLMIVVLLVRPSGLFGDPEVEH